VYKGINLIAYFPYANKLTQLCVNYFYKTPKSKGTAELKLCGYGSIDIVLKTHYRRITTTHHSRWIILGAWGRHTLEGAETVQVPRSFARRRCRWRHTSASHSDTTLTLQWFSLFISRLADRTAARSMIGYCRFLDFDASVDEPNHWRRQLWGTGARPLDIQLFIFIF